MYQTIDTFIELGEGTTTDVIDMAPDQYQTLAMVWISGRGSI